MDNNIKIPVSIGELFDKITILLIKIERIPGDVNCIQDEMNKLILVAEPFNLDINIFNNLKNINSNLWYIEEDIRKKEKKQEFDQEFIDLARSVYKKNDIRSRIKKDINDIFNSVIIEVKSYEKETINSKA